MNIYYLGPEGSYSHRLVTYQFPHQTAIACVSFQEVVRQTEENPGSIGILGIENSISSTVHESIDLLFAHDLYIVGEASMTIKLHLIGQKGARMEDITHVFSHPQALAQCRQFLKRYPITMHEMASTTAAVFHIHETGANDEAAIAGEIPLSVHSLDVIGRNIGDFQHNMTRWMFVSTHPLPLSDTINKVTGIFEVKHEPGSLVRVLQSIAAQQGNLTKIESRPVAGSDWEYAFWVDIEISAGKQDALITLLQKETHRFRLVGAYERGTLYENN